MPQLLKLDLPGVAGSILTKTWMLQRSYNWQLMMPENINGIIGVLVSQYCQDASVGNYSISELSSIRYGGFQRFYPGIQTITSAKFSFIAPIDNSVYDYFSGWRKLAIDDNGYYYPKSRYAKRIYLCMYDRSGVQSLQLTLIGAFPRGLPVIDLSYSKEEVLKYDVDIIFDYIETKSLTGLVRSSIINVATNTIGSSAKSKLGL